MILFFTNVRLFYWDFMSHCSLSVVMLFVCSAPLIIVPYFTCILGSLNKQERAAKYESPFRHIIRVLKRISNSLFFFPLLSQQSAIVTPALDEIIEYLSHVQTSTTQLSHVTTHETEQSSVSQGHLDVLLYITFLSFTLTSQHTPDITPSLHRLQPPDTLSPMLSAELRYHLNSKSRNDPPRGQSWK